MPTQSTINVYTLLDANGVKKCMELFVNSLAIHNSLIYSFVAEPPSYNHVVSFRLWNYMYMYITEVCVDTKQHCMQIHTFVLLTNTVCLPIRYRSCCGNSGGWCDIFGGYFCGISPTDYFAMLYIMEVEVRRQDR